MADIFGSVGAPRWMSPTENNIAQRELGMREAQPFAQGFMSAFDQAQDQGFRREQVADERRWQEEQVNRAWMEVKPAVDALKNVDSYDQAIETVRKHPEWLMNPRTGPIVAKTVQTWDAAERVKNMAQSSKIVRDRENLNTRFETSLNEAAAADPTVLSDIAAINDKDNNVVAGWIVNAVTGERVAPSSPAQVRLNQHFQKQGLASWNTTKEQARMLLEREKAQSQQALLGQKTAAASDLLEQRIEGQKELQAQKDSSAMDRLQEAMEGRLDYAKLQADLAKDKVDAKTANRFIAELKVQESAVREAHRKLIKADPGTDAYQSALKQWNDERSRWQKMWDRHEKETAAPSAPAAAPSGAAAPFRFDPQSGQIVPNK